MVRILANGDIVQDDDPRATARARTQSSTPRPRQGGIQHDSDNPQGGMMGAAGGVSSFFTNLNQRLLDAGLPRWNLGSYPVEPIMTVGTLLAVMFFGLAGLLMAAFLFFVTNMGGATGSATGTTQPTNTPGGGSSGHSSGNTSSGNRTVFGGSGHTLGK